MGRTIDGFQALAWIAWRHKKATEVFSGEDAEGLWSEALAGRYPQSLGNPVTKPAVAEMMLRAAIAQGELHNVASHKSRGG